MLLKIRVVLKLDVATGLYLSVNRVEKISDFEEDDTEEVVLVRRRVEHSAGKNGKEKSEKGDSVAGKVVGDVGRMHEPPG